MATIMNVTDSNLKTLISEAQSANEQIKAWSAIKAETTAKIEEILEADLAKVRKELENKDSLTTSITYQVDGQDAVVVTVGFELKTDQSTLAKMADSRPETVGVLLKRTYAPIARPWCVKEREGREGVKGLAAEVKNATTYTQKKNSFCFK